MRLSSLSADASLHVRVRMREQLLPSHAIIIIGSSLNSNFPFDVDDRSRMYLERIHYEGYYRR